MQRQEGENYITFIERKTASDCLTSPRTLIFDLGLLKTEPQSELERAVKMQYQLAKRIGDREWIKQVRREATVIFRPGWIDDHLPSTTGATLTQTRKRRSGHSSATETMSSSGMCQDVRLLKDPSLPVVRHNVAETNPEPVISEPDRSSVPIVGASLTVGQCVSVPSDEPDVPVPVVAAESSIQRGQSEQDSAPSDIVTAPSRRKTMVFTSRGQPRSSRTVAMREEAVTPSKRPKLDLQNLDRIQISIPTAAVGLDTEKPSKCPFPNCKTVDKKLKRHVFGKHLPWIFMEQSEEPDLDQRRFKAISSLAEYRFGTHDALQSAVEFINRSGQMPKTSVITSEARQGMLNLCHHQQWDVPVEDFQLHPLNSPAVLIHWRSLVVLLLGLTAGEQKQFCVTGRLASVEDDREGICEDDEDLVLVDECRGSDSGGESDPLSDHNNNSEVAGYQAFDSHFHLDRTSTKLWGRFRDHTVEDLLDHSSSSCHRPNININLIGGIVVYSEPTSHPKEPLVSRRWRTAVGVHPKHVHELSTQRFRHLQKLLEFPQVVALGEIGLDRTVSTGLWRHQEEVFCQVLSLTKPSRPLVLHLRGTRSDHIGMDVHARAMQLMEKNCVHHQLLHIHCFTGDRQLVQDWLERFPRAYFGVTGAAGSFREEQIQGLASIPADRLLLETDSPYLPVGPSTVNTPAYLGDVASVIAPHLKMSIKEILQLTATNAQKLYGDV